MRPHDTKRGHICWAGVRLKEREMGKKSQRGSLKWEEENDGLLVSTQTFRLIYHRFHPKMNKNKIRGRKHLVNYLSALFIRGLFCTKE